MLINSILPLLEGLANLAIPVAVTFLLPHLIKLLKDRLTDRQEKTLATVAEGAYWAVERIVRKTPTQVDDKLAAGLKEVADALGRDPNDDEAKKVKALFNQMNEKKKRGSLSLSGMN